jgi:hypothetical protein
MQVYLSVENTCKFCDWKITEKQKPIFVNRKNGQVFAFCPMCQFELDISWQEDESKVPSSLYKWCEEKDKSILDQKATCIGIVDKDL